VADAVSDVTVRPATADDHLPVMRILDAALLEIDAETVDRRIDADTVLVAVDDDRIVGALVATPRTDETGDEPSNEQLDVGARNDGAHVDAIAVQQRRRAQGIGSRLVDAAARRWLPLTAAFDAAVKPFYDGLGFDCEEGEGERFRGVLETE
jgi:GNAT superfamily N-acetyltransferase